MDPYSVLGVSPGASQEEIKKKYRELVKKYHPDKVRGTAKEHEYEEKLKQINEAYDTLTKNPSGSSSGGGYGGYRYSGRSGYGGSYGNYGYSGGSSGSTYSSYSGEFAQEFMRVRQCIQSGNLAAAESILEGIPIKNAEWHFLKGVILQRRGWYDGAKEHFSTAYQMNPDNPEYAQAYSQMSGGYQSFYGGQGDGMDDCCRLCSCLMCMNACCGGGRC